MGELRREFNVLLKTLREQEAVDSCFKKLSAFWKAFSFSAQQISEVL